MPKSYVPAGVPVTWGTRLAAIQAWLEPDCVFSHRCAAALMGLDGVSDRFLEVACHRAPRPPKGVIVHRLRREDQPRTIFIDGFPVTNPERTVFDLYAVLPPQVATLALEDALRKRMTTIDRLWDTYGELGKPGRNGSAGFRRALLVRDDADGKLASRMESLLLHILRKLPAPAAVPQYPIETGGGRFYVDFAYPDVKLALEAHSIRWHLGVDKNNKDLVRDRWLKRAGWTTLYYSWDDMRFRSEDVRREVLEVRSSLQSRLL